MILILSRASRVATRVADILAGDTDAVETAPQLIREVNRQPDVSCVVIGEDIDLVEAGEASEELRVADPSIAVILLRQRVDLGVTTEAMKSGVRSVLSASDIRGLVEQVEQQEQVSSAIRARMAGRSLEAPQGTVVLVYSAKGGVGKTTTSLNVAATLAEDSSERVVVVDLDLQFGDVGVAVGKPDSDKSLSALPRETGAITLEGIEKNLEQLTENLWVLLAPRDPAQADTITAGIVERVLEELARSYDWVVVDSPPAFTDEILAAFDRSDVQVLISTPDLASVKNLSVAASTLHRIGLDKAARCVVLNRFDTRAGMDRAELIRAAETVAETKKVFVVPDQPAILRSSSMGYVASLGPRGDKIRKLYRGVVAFVRDNRARVRSSQ